MPTRNVNLTGELDSFVLANVQSGRYENASEVVRAALMTFEREELKVRLTPHSTNSIQASVTPSDWRLRTASRQC